MSNSQRPISSYRVHNFCRYFGYTAGKGVCQSITDKLLCLDVPVLANVQHTWSGEALELLQINDGWARQHNVDVRALRQYIVSLLMTAMNMANLHGRKQVKACDVLLLHEFSTMIGGGGNPHVNLQA